MPSRSQCYHKRIDTHIVCLCISTIDSLEILIILSSYTRTYTGKNKLTFLITIHQHKSALPWLFEAQLRAVGRASAALRDKKNNNQIRF